MAIAPSFTCLLLTSSLLLASWFIIAIEAQSRPPIVNGLSWTFYQSSCPKLESIIRNELKKIFKKDVGQAAGLLRLHSHDCFVLGCDGSVLLDKSNERSEIPNLTMRKEAFKIVNDLRERVHKQCGRVVSCADILTIAARDSVFLTGGPDYDVPLGRRDGVKMAKVNQTFVDLVAPFATTGTVLAKFARKGLDDTDTVALSGAHTIGISQCSSFTDRLYPRQDPNMDKNFANNLKKICPRPNSNAVTVLDIRTPDTFDNKYFVDLMNRQGLFTSDQDLFIDARTKDIVTSFAVNEGLFFEKFVLAMIKMGQIEVLTGGQGEIRGDCSVRNSDKNKLVSVVGEDLGSSSEMK